MQTDLEFLNTFDEEKHYLVVLIGNSETFGMNQEFDKRLHILLQKKLRNTIQSKDIFVVNASYPGGMVSDHLRDLLIFSLFYKPDLAIIYSGGNELILKKKYAQIVEKEMVLNKDKITSLNFFKNEFFLPKNILYCLNSKKFLTNENFEKDNSLFDLEIYMKLHFEKIKETLNKNLINFMFYIQPLSTKVLETDTIYPNYIKLKNLDFKDSKFNNLNLKKVSENLDFLDAFHTKNAEQIADILLRDIIKEHKSKILNKIN